MESDKQQKIHFSGYQARDYDVVNYHQSELPGTGLNFRGPFPDTDRGNYFTCIGAAQTLGCFCEKSFPTLLEDELGLPVLNLGYGGAGPEFFASHQSLIDYINKGRFLILQAMSGRSQSNSLFDSGGLEYITRRKDGASLGASEAYRELLGGSQFIKSIPPARLTRVAARLLAQPEFKRIIAETRQGWLDQTASLLDRVKVPVIFFWFSKRTPAYSESYKILSGIFSEFPHLINQEMVDTVAGRCEHYIECISDRGSPQPLFNRFTGEPTTVDPSNDRPDLGGAEPWTHNIYYPSPEMHEDAFCSLLETCQNLVSTNPSAGGK